jgi:hypothetical protein
MHKTSRTWTIGTILLAHLVSFTSGCGKAPSKSAPNVNALSDARVETAEVSVKNASDEVSLAEVTEFAGDDLQAEGLATQLQSLAVEKISEEQEANIAEKTVSEAPVLPKVPAPTPEQIAKWTQPEFEPWQLLARRPSDELKFVSCSSASSDGKWLVLGGDKLILWKTGEDRPISILWEFPNSTGNETINSVAVSPNDQWLAAGSSEGMLRLWRLTDQKEVISKKIYRNNVVQIAISDDSQEIATCTHGADITIWASETLNEKKKLAAAGSTKLCYSGPNKLAVAGKAMEVWNTETGEKLETLMDDGYPQSIARSMDRTWCGVASDEKLQLIHVQDAELTRQVEGSFARNELLSFSADGKQLWTANGDTLRAWDLERGITLQVIDTIGPAIVGIDYLADEQLLRVVTEDGTQKLWGTVAAGEALGLKALHAPVKLPDPAQLQPATSAQLLAAIDLRSLPRPPNSQATAGASSMLQFQTGEPVDEVKSFYRYLLGKRGWTEQAGNAATPDYLSFEKEGFRVFASVSTNSPTGTTVYLVGLGNVDASSIPKLDFAPIQLAYEDKSSATYKIKSDLSNVEVELLRKFHSAGWLPFSRINSSHSEFVDKRSLEFVRNAMTVRVSATPLADDPSTINVQYTTFTAQSHLPAPDDCDYLETDVGKSPAIVAFTSLALEPCQAFYNQAMLSDGWLVAGSIENSNKDVRWLSYFRGQQEVTLRLSSTEDGRTCIHCGTYTDENSWQLRQAEATTNAEESDAETKPGIQAADMPLYKIADAKTVKYDTRFKQIDVTIPKTSHIEIVDHYAKILGEQGWTEEPGGFRAEDYAFVTFTQGDTSIAIRINSNDALNTTTYGLSDDGILWTKPLPERKELVSYEAWLRKHHHPATLRFLEAFLSEMRSIENLKN